MNTCPAIPTVSVRPVMTPENVKHRNLEAALKLSDAVSTGPDIWGTDAKHMPAGVDVVKILPTGTAHILSKTLNPFARHGRNERDLASVLDSALAFDFNICDCQSFTGGRFKGQDCRHILLSETVANTPDKGGDFGIASRLRRGDTVLYAYALPSETCHDPACGAKAAFYARVEHAGSHYSQGRDFCAECGFCWRVSN